MNKDLSDLNSEYCLELERIVKNIRQAKAKRVLLQFPDQMKPYSSSLTKKLKKELPNIDIFIWLGSCYGACDTPIISKSSKIDLLVQFGHSPWKS